MNENRSFLKKVLAAGVDCGEIEPGDILAHVTPQVLAHHLPVELKAKLLGASLDAREMSPDLVIQVVGIDALTEHSPVGALWACIEQAVKARLGDASQEAPDASSRKKASKKSSGASASDSRAPAGRAEAKAAKEAKGNSAGKSTSRSRRSRASTEADRPADEEGEVPRKPNRSAQPDAPASGEVEATVPEGARVTEIEGSAEGGDSAEGDGHYEVEFEEAIDELVADEPSNFEEIPSLFDIDTKVGGPTAPPGEFGDDDTSPGAKRRGEGS